MNDECKFCREHEKGEYLYESIEWSGGIEFQYIKNIQYCPLCGKELKEEN